MVAVLVVSGVSLLGSFVCSIFEAALYAVTPSRVEALRRKGVAGAARLSELRGRIDEPIAAILSLNTITHTMGAAWAGALVDQHFGPQWITWFGVVFTLAMLFATEIVPKTLGVVHASRLAPLFAWPIQVLIWVMWPLAWLSLRVTRRLTRRAKAAGPSEDEILVMADLALQAGELLPDELRILQNTLRLNDVRIRDIMTPRNVVENLPADTPLGQLIPRTLVHSRLLVAEKPNDLDSVVGVVYRRDIYDRLARDEHEVAVRSLMRPVRFLYERQSAHAVLRQMLNERLHFAAVADEHGSVVGVVTLEDVLEQLLGREIVDEYDAAVDLREEARKRARFWRRS